jgi:cell division transport system permease protein
MSLASVPFLIEEAGKNIRRNGLMSLAALSTVTIAMGVLGGALFTIYRLHQFAQAQPKQFEMEIFLKQDVPREKTEEVQHRIEQIPTVAYVHLFTKEQAWKAIEEKDRARGTNITEALGDDNPLPDRLDVHLKDPRQTAQTAKLLRDSKEYPEIHQVLDAREDLDKVIAFSRLVSNIGGISAVVLFLATSLVIQNTIRLTVAARKREIRIMQLVGATRWFIRLPMILEGIFYGVLGAGIAAGLVVLVASQISNYAGKLVSPLTQNMPEAIAPGLFISGLVGVGAVVGWLGSTLSIRRFLKRI